jgi:hypothetical protein
MRWIHAILGIVAALVVSWHGVGMAQQTPPLVVPAGVTVQLAVMRPVWAKTTRTGDLLYAETTAPVLVGKQIAIPAGSYVSASIQGIVRPTSRVAHAVMAVAFNKLVFADGYTVDLVGSGSPYLAATVTIQVTAQNDLLLDNGTPVVMTLQNDLPLDAQKVAQAVPLSHAPVPSQFVPATLCRFIPGSPGSPGTSDTVIPGTPGTPDTIIPGIDGGPPTVIPGTPATPSTTIPGTPATPATDPVYCPAPPQVLSSVPGYVSPAPNAKASSKQ